VPARASKPFDLPVPSIAPIEEARMTRITLSLSLLALLAAPLLAGCNTTAGAGEDIARTGKVIERTAVRATP